MIDLLFVLLVIGAIGVLSIKRASIMVWTISFAFICLLTVKYYHVGVILGGLMWAVFGIMLACSFKSFREQFISKHNLAAFSKMMPHMSKTEQEALEAGSLGWEADLFTGEPDFSKLQDIPKFKLSQKEQDFLDGPVHELCRLSNDWEITHEIADLPPSLWEFIKKERFFGMIIPEKFGGLGFSASGVKAVLSKLYGRSITVATTVAVPNSLGPAELLLKYGTKSQQDHYLPRLADGREIPCFALTGPNAGSDAASIPDSGVVCRGSFNGKDTLGIRLNWDKRYITLSPVATVIGLAFRLFDPESLLGREKDIGITCALIPSDTQGVTSGRRHFPLNNPFMNGPTQGKDVFIPLDYIIGGAKMAGQGWKMLMECLSAGRAISLPSSSVGGSKAASIACGAYARVRKQFNQPIGKFEGIEEPLARIAGKTYIMDSALSMTATAIDGGAKSAVAGAILKYHATEMAREIGMDAMDIHGGKGICLGPNNYLGRGYAGAPISITVEGANILTRSLIIFGQGVIRCHPFVLKEIESTRAEDIAAFDKAFWGHTSFFLSNWAKSILFSITDGYFLKAPGSIYTKRYYQLIHRYSANLAYLSDFCMTALGADLKRKEKISARLGDVVSHLYMVSAVLHRFENDGEPKHDKDLLDWSCQYLFKQTEDALHGVITNMPVTWQRLLLKLFIQPFGQYRKKPNDELGHRVANMLITENETRERLAKSVFLDPLPNCPLGRVEDAFKKICAVADIEKKLSKGIKKGDITSLGVLEQIEEAESKDIISADEAKKLLAAEHARQEVIAVDDFSSEELAVQGSKNRKKQPVQA